MKTLNYDGMEMTIEALEDLAKLTEQQATNKRELASKTYGVLFRQDLESQATDREHEAKSIRAFLERNRESAPEASTHFIVSLLIRNFGRRFLALAAGVSSIRVVKLWELGELSPTHEEEVVLRSLAETCEVLDKQMSLESISSWFMGSNPDLDDEAPVIVLKRDPERVLQSAKALVS